MVLDRKALVQSITFNIEINGELHEGVTVKYGPTDKLTFGDIHFEDNDSWKLVKIGEKTYYFQIYGDDDSVIWKGRRKKLDNILKTRLSIDLYEMYECDGKLCISSNVYSNIIGNAKINRVRINTNKGSKGCHILFGT
jgi:hypothetical protein